MFQCLNIIIVLKKSQNIKNVGEQLSIMNYVILLNIYIFEAYDSTIRK